jgi:hypothetical protein
MFPVKPPSAQIFTAFRLDFGFSLFSVDAFKGLLFSLTGLAFPVACLLMPDALFQVSESRVTRYAFYPSFILVVPR